MAEALSILGSRLVASGLVTEAQLAQCSAALSEPADDAKLLKLMIQLNLLTNWQAAQVQAGQNKGFFLEHYKLLDLLGAGGMGQVFRALDTELNRQVAIKLLPKRLATPDAVARFRREGQAALQVQHENLVRSFELGQQGDTHFLVMELVEGTNLAKFIAKKGKLSAQETARIGYEVALALEHARQQGIIHRDIKPSNILLTRKGQVKLADLGLAKFFDARETRSGPMTRTGAFMGTVDYVSPEQAEDSKRADTRSDIYSLGCTLYHCLTGRPPFADGSDVQKIVCHLEREPVPIYELNPEIPQSFSDLILRRMLAKRPGERFQTPAETAQALKPWVTGESEVADLSRMAVLLEEEQAAESVEKPPSTLRDRQSKPPGSRPQKVVRSEETAPVWEPPSRVRRRRWEATLLPIGLAAVICLVLAWVFGPWRPKTEPGTQFLARPGQETAKGKAAPPGIVNHPVGGQDSTGRQDVNKPDQSDLASPQPATGETAGTPTAEPAKPRSVNRPPTVEIVSVDPPEPMAGGSLTFKLSGTDPDGDPVVYEFRNGENGAWTSAPDGVVTINDLKPGPLTVAVRSLDRAGTSSDLVSRSFKVKEAPVDLSKFPKEVTNSIGMKLVLIPNGNFMMGSPDTEAERATDEGPQHRVTITRPFFMGIYEVTVGNFREFVREESYKTEAETDGQGGSGFNSAKRKWERGKQYNWQKVGWPQSDNHPVVNMSWNDAKAFCDWLSRKEQKTYRLPTEAEWEYACRASTTTRFWSGDDNASLQAVANIADRSLKQRIPISGSVSWNDGHAFSAPVGQFQPNKFGLYDMHGNVWEWCQDYYDAKYYEQRVEVDPPGPGTGGGRVLRGGSWSNDPRYTRSADRLRNAPDVRRISIGFRVVCELGVRTP